MKRFLLRLLIIGLLLPGFIACGGGAPDTPAETDVAPEQVNPTEPLAQPDDSAQTEPTVAPDTTQAEGQPLRTPYLEYGVAAQLFYTDRERATTLMRNANFDWVRQQIHWKDVEGPKGNFGWEELDAIVDAANAQDIKVLISIVRTPAWANPDGSTGLPTNPKDLGDFVEALATRYKGRVQGYEIWNEQNLDHENGGLKENINPGHYVDILVEAYTRIKAVDPDAYVVSGALTSTGDSPSAFDDMQYFEAMFTYNNGIFKDHVDAVGFHPAPAYNPPDTKWPDNPGPGPGWQDHPTHYFRHVEDLRDLMVAHGMENYQIWITEIGYATQNNSPGYEYGNSISFEQQAEYMLGALQRTRNEYPYVGMIVIWNLNFSILWTEEDPAQEFHEQSSFSILNPDWSPRPVFTAVQGFINSVKAEEGRLN